MTHSPIGRRNNQSLPRLLLAGCLLLIGSTPGASAAEPPAGANAAAESKLPKVVLLGDSIRLSYAPRVARQLEGKVVIISPGPNGGDSANELRNLSDWAIKQQPAVVHLNAGIHDTKKFKSDGHFQVSPEQYEANLRKIVAQLRAETQAVILFATTTPILDARAAAARQGRDYELLNASIEQYNQIALRVMKELDVPVNDLYARLAKPPEGTKLADLIVGDGVHLTPAGQDLVAETVAAFITSQLPK